MMIKETVPIIDEIPPRVKRASTALLPVFDTKPLSIRLARLLAPKPAGFWIKIIPTDKKILAKSVSIAGTFFQAQTNIKMIGRAAQADTEKFLVNTFSTAVILAKEVALLLWPRKKKRTSETKKAGMVDHIMFLIWSKRSLSATAEARLVESDSGDILSPKIAPEMMAPAVIAGLIPSVLPIPKRAMPTVEMVVKPEPMAKPTIEQTKKTDGRKKWTLIM